MAYSVSTAFREQCYSGSSLYSCRLIIGSSTIPISQIESITISSPIIDSNSETFYIGTFISQKLTIKFKNLDGIETASGTNVELYISQYVNNSWVEVPIGKYLIDESPENYYQTATIECLDYAIKFATNLDYSSALVDNKITIDNLLAWICTHYGVTLGSYPNTNGSVEIGTYDSTISGKRWISYIAEIKGCNAKMDRLGQLTLVPVKSSPAVTIDALKSASWELGEKYEIKKVTFFDALRNYTYGDDTGNTLFIRQDNPYIVDTEVVENIYNAVKDYVCYSLKTENYGDISLDAWDNITYTLGNESYNTLNNNTITYAMTIMSKVETKIPTKQQEVTTNVFGGNEEVQIRKLKTEVNTIENTITIQAQEIATIEEDIQNPTSTKQGTSIDITDALNSPLIDFKMYGDTQQDSTTGANLQKYNERSVTTINYKCDSTGQITTNGTASSDTDIAINQTNNEMLLEAGTYKLKLVGTIGAINGVKFNINGTLGSSIYLDSNNECTLTLSSTSTVRTLIPIYSGNSYVTNFYVTLAKNNSTTERYTNGASPNPSYPQPIQVVTGRNDINVCGKNLFDKNNIETGKYYKTSTIDTSSNWAITQIKVQPNSNYYLSGNNYNNTTAKIVLLDSSKNILSNLGNYNAVHSITTTSNTAYIGLSIAIYSDSNDLNTMQLEKSSTASTYSPYTGYTQEINLGKNLFDKDNANILNLGMSSLNRQISTNDNRRLSYISCQPNTTYTIQKRADGNNNNFIVATSTEIPANGITVNNIVSNANATSITITSGNNDIYLIVQFYRTDETQVTEQQILDSIQIEKGSSASTYSSYFTPIELCKISTYQDYIYKTNDKWYIHKEIGKYTFTGNENWSSQQYGTNSWLCSSFLNTISNDNIKLVISNIFYGISKADRNNEYSNSCYANSSTTFYIRNTTLTTQAQVQSATSGNYIYYILATPTETEITNSELVGQLDSLMSNSLLKGLNHITNETFNLYPNLFIEYFRDTSLNENFVSKEDMTKYYTKTETDAQILINSSSIQQSVSELSNTTNNNTSAIDTISNQVNTLQSSTSFQINAINEQLENGVPKVKTTTGYTFDNNGLSITKGQGFSSLTTDRYQKIEYNGKELSFMGYDDTLNKPISRIEELEARKITTGVHRTETIQEDSEYWTAQYYVGGGN